MTIEYKLPEKPCFYLSHIEQAFKEKRPVICHKSRKNAIAGLTEHGYLQFVNADDSARMLFDKFERGAKLNTRFQSKIEDTNIDNYVFLEITTAGLTALYYVQAARKTENYWCDKIDSLKKEILNLISNKFKEI